MRDSYLVTLDLLCRMDNAIKASQIVLTSRLVCGLALCMNSMDVRAMFAQPFRWNRLAQLFGTETGTDQLKGLIAGLERLELHTVGCVLAEIPDGTSSHHCEIFLAHVCSAAFLLAPHELSMPNGEFAREAARLLSDIWLTLAHDP